jgi:hypothetical protein
MTHKPPQSVRDQGQRWLRLSIYKMRKRDKARSKGGKTMTQKYNWPTREEWARNERTLYADQTPSMDWRLTSVASEAEITAIIVAHEALWRDLGRQMKTASKEPRSEFKRDTEYDRIQWRRKLINRRLKELRDGRLPMDVDEAFKETFAPLRARQRSNWEATCEAAAREKQKTPVDDAAWEKELRRRKWLEDRKADDAAHPERFIHRV